MHIYRVENAGGHGIFRSRSTVRERIKEQEIKHPLDWSWDISDGPGPDDDRLLNKIWFGELRYESYAWRFAFKDLRQLVAWPGMADACRVAPLGGSRVWRYEVDPAYVRYGEAQVLYHPHHAQRDDEWELFTLPERAKADEDDGISAAVAACEAKREERLAGDAIEKRIVTQAFPDWSTAPVPSTWPSDTIETFARAYGASPKRTDPDWRGRTYPGGTKWVQRPYIKPA